MPYLLYVYCQLACMVVSALFCDISRHCSVNIQKMSWHNYNNYYYNVSIADTYMHLLCLLTFQLMHLLYKVRGWQNQKMSTWQCTCWSHQVELHATPNQVPSRAYRLYEKRAWNSLLTLYTVKQTMCIYLLLCNCRKSSAKGSECHDNEVYFRLHALLQYKASSLNRLVQSPAWLAVSQE